jgi:hypothetical protein
MAAAAAAVMKVFMARLRVVELKVVCADGSSVEGGDDLQYQFSIDFMHVGYRKRLDCSIYGRL